MEKTTWKRIVSYFAASGLALSIIAGCSGKNSMSSPQVYGNPSSTSSTVDSTAKAQATVADSSEAQANQALLNILLNNNSRRTDAAGKEDKGALRNQDYIIDGALFYGSTDSDDSASAVDDDLWRQFSLADEYHAMGVIANREGSWEEAQYYFEKALRILAALDVESDSTLTPEADRYNSLLENLIADYQVTLRSLGNLTEDVSVSVLLERFSDIEAKLEDDTMVVYGSEPVQKITYDIPIVMNERVERSIIYFQTVAREAFYKYLRRSEKYKSLMYGILDEHGLPRDLVYLSLVESGYNPHAYSWARAMGLWQFIASTGRLYGLDRNWWIDERKDPVKATHAAARFLKDLYEEFGDWELAMAAYNGGPGRVRRTISSQKTRDFWSMRLKRQTMDYVPLIMAATIIAKDPEKYGFENVEFEPPIDWDEVVIDRCLELSVVARAVGCSVSELQELNPELLRKYTPPNYKKYTLKIPKGTTPKFLAAYDEMPSPKETSWVQHKIRRGETVSTIASRYGVSQYAILEANNLRRTSTIYAGKTLIVPVPLDREFAGESRHEYVAENSVYTVRSGDTMWDIARAFGTTVDALRRINYIERGSRIYVGQKLKIPSTGSNVVYSDAGSSSRSSSSTGSSTYKVRRGDTLWDIARKFNTTTSRLRALNGLGRSSRIYPGQVLTVDGSGSGSNYVVHRVRRGETLGAIARKYGTSISRIMANNRIADPDRLMIGESLRIYTN